MKRSTALILSASAATTLLSMPALAQFQSEIDRLDSLRSGTFYLTSQDMERELVRYSSPRDIRLCLQRAEDESEQLSALTVRWDNDTEAGQTAEVHPGNCLHFEATRITVSPAEELPDGVIFEGTLDVGGRS